MNTIELSRNKVNVALARKQISVTELAAIYGVSRTRINVILNSRTISPITAGRIAEALGIDVTEILED